MTVEIFGSQLPKFTIYPQIIMSTSLLDCLRLSAECNISNIKIMQNIEWEMPAEETS